MCLKWGVTSFQKIDEIEMWPTSTRRQACQSQDSLHNVDSYTFSKEEMNPARADKLPLKEILCIWTINSYGARVTTGKKS